MLKKPSESVLGNSTLLWVQGGSTLVEPFESVVVPVDAVTVASRDEILRSTKKGCNVC